MILLLQNQMLFAIKAPEASYLEVPDPDEVLRVDTWNLKIVEMYFYLMQSLFTRAGYWFPTIQNDS